MNVSHLSKDIDYIEPKSLREYIEGVLESDIRSDNFVGIEQASTCHKNTLAYNLYFKDSFWVCNLPKATKGIRSQVFSADSDLVCFRIYYETTV